MKLFDLLCKIYENTTVWISDDPSNSDGIYFGAAGEIKLRDTKGYEVVELYPEAYPAIQNFFGVTIIVRKENTNVA